jgi:glycine betaine/proline transport system substrate-binding protein
MRNRLKGAGLLLAVASAGVVLAACGGGINSNTQTPTSSPTGATTSAAPTSSAAPEPKECGEWGIAMHAWVGYTASAQVITNVAEQRLGCKINQVQLDEAGVTYDAMEAGSVDVIIEDWGGGRWAEWVDRGAIKEVGPNGNVGLIGMFVPQWMADEYPDITDSANLNKYADLFKTPESGDKGAWYEGPPGYTTIGEKMIEANGLNYKVINTGSEAALIELFTKASENKTPALGYFYEPQNFLAKVPLARIKFPANDWTDAAKASGLTDYPETELVKLATVKLMDSGSPFATLLTNFGWTNDDQNQVALDIENGMSPAEAADKWILANEALVNEWLVGTGAE